ncbi:MAG: hypothetical protein LBN10_00320 [Propionibacteriaceae bacterium]|nr:hypothetical protein [Propionibacteriaceae bacterium]
MSPPHFMVLVVCLQASEAVMTQIGCIDCNELVMPSSIAFATAHPTRDQQ